MAAITHPDALAAIKLTLTVVVIAVPLNAIFGIMAAWTLTKFNFKGKNLLLTIVDLPFAVSPVIAGLIFILLFGSQVYLVNGSLKMILRLFLRFLGLCLLPFLLRCPLSQGNSFLLCRHREPLRRRLLFHLAQVALKHFGM